MSETYTEAKLRDDLNSGDSERIALAIDLIAMRLAKDAPRERQEKSKAPAKEAEQAGKREGAERQSKAVSKHSFHGEVIPAKGNGGGEKKSTREEYIAKINNTRQQVSEPMEEQTAPTKDGLFKASPRPTAARRLVSESGAAPPRAPSGDSLQGSLAGTYKAFEDFVEVFPLLEERIMMSLASHMSGIRTTMEHQAQELHDLRRGTMVILEEQAAINKRLGWMQRDAAERALKSQSNVDGGNDDGKEDGDE